MWENLQIFFFLEVHGSSNPYSNNIKNIIFDLLAVLLKQISKEQCRRYGGQRSLALLTAAFAPSPHFNLLKILFLEHHVTTRQQTTMQKKL